MDRLDPQLAPLGISQLWHRTVEEIEKKGKARKKVAFAEGLRPSTPPFGGLGIKESAPLEAIKILMHRTAYPSPLVAITDLCLMDPTSRKTNVDLSNARPQASSQDAVPLSPYLECFSVPFGSRCIGWILSWLH